MANSLPLPYSHYTNAQLAKFAARHGLHVTTSRRWAHARRRKALLKALEGADANWRFPFFDLPGELRNLIYQELLTSPPTADGVITCHPQILGTCKQAYAEANNILYGDNTIEIRIQPHGVFANGQRCGLYQPTIGDSGDLPNFTLIQWPDFLRRCWNLRITAPDSAWRRLQPLSPAVVPAKARFPALSNTVYSLARFLAEENKIRDFGVVFVFSGYYPPGQGEEYWRGRYDQGLDPVRLLGEDAREGVEATVDLELDVPRIMEGLLFDGTAEIARYRLRHGSELRRHVELCLRVLIFVPILLAIWWCHEHRPAARKWLSAFLHRWYSEDAIVFAARRTENWRRRCETGTMPRGMSESAVREQTERVSKLEVDYRVFSAQQEQLIHPRGE